MKKICQGKPLMPFLNDLVLAAQNVYTSALGVCAIALESALTDFGQVNNPSDCSPKGQLRSFVYQMRNAFAHDAMTPSKGEAGARGRATPNPGTQVR